MSRLIRLIPDSFGYKSLAQKAAWVNEMSFFERGDRYAHSMPPGEISPAFLTRYGYHVLQGVSYERGEEASDDQSEVRHVLAMYPFEQEDPRKEIEALVKSCKIRVLEAGFRNAVPPELRDRIVP